MARPTALTPEIHQRLVAYKRGGAFDAAAARAVGIHPSTLGRWKRRGEREAGVYRDLLEDLERAGGEARVVAEHRVFEENPLAWLRVVARTLAGEPGWTESVRHELSGPDGGPIPIEAIDRILKEAKNDGS